MSKRPTKTPRQTTKPLWRHLVRIVAWAIGIAITIGLALMLWFSLSPWPSAMLIRHSFEQGDLQTNKILEKYAPEGITVTKDIHSDTSDAEALLDVYRPKAGKKPLGTIVWVHGGGWLAGNKDDLKPWAEILAGEGFSVVAPNYSLAPERTYPLPVSQTNKAVNYIVEHAAQLSIDPEKLLLAGDSAGAQIAAQVALIHTNPTYAKNIGMSPSRARHTVAGLLLNCGPYDLRLAQGNASSAGAKLVRTFLWSYTGHKDFMKAPRIEYASIPEYVTKDFPASFITVGSADPLAPHSYALAKALKDVDVQTDTLFYADDHQPALNHEYQFNLDTADGKTALSRMMTFAKQVVQ